MRLLIVDDSMVVRRRIHRELCLPEFYVVGSAATGQRAIELARSTQPDVVTMDLTMPGMDGVECIPRLLKIVPMARILVISALADKATAIEALRRGARGFLPKPFSTEQLNLAFSELMTG